LPFTTALDLSVSAAEAIHIGDLRRSDVAGARAAYGNAGYADHDDNQETRVARRWLDRLRRCGGCDPVCERPRRTFRRRELGEVDRLLGLE